MISKRSRDATVTIQEFADEVVVIVKSSAVDESGDIFRGYKPKAKDRKSKVKDGTS
jgi:hypothetical protein